MRTLQSIVLFIFCSLFITFLGCRKYLDKKPNSQLYVPDRWQDLQALLDNNSLLNFNSSSALIQTLTDDYSISDQRYNNLSPEFQAAYIWDDTNIQVLEGWNLPYQAIYTSNVVLDGLERIKKNTPAKELDNLKGSALFYRAFAFYYLLQLYSKPYSNFNQDDLGIVLKLTASVTNKEGRSTINDAYMQVINDLTKCLELLPQESENIMRPGLTAAKAMLARVYLSMQDFDNASKFSLQVIKDKSDLLDYNELVPASAPVMPSFLINPEVIYFSVLQSNSLTSPNSVIIDTNLFKEYEMGDIRRSAFFTLNPSAGVGKYRFKGSYYNITNYSVFYGLTVGEMYLIAAECFARKNMVQDALTKLNSLLLKRYKYGSFVEYTTQDVSELLNIVLLERRKELVFRGQRWTDIKRFNVEGRNISLDRTVNGIVHVLAPNELKSILLIPEVEIIRSGIPQNPR